VFDDHVDGEVGRVPVLIDDDDLLAGAARGRGYDAGFADASEGEAAKRLGAQILLFEERIVGGSARRCAVGWRDRRPGKNALASEMCGGIDEDVEAAGGIVDVGGEKGGIAFKASGNETATLVVDAPGGRAGDVVDCRANVRRAVGKLLVGDDVDRSAEGFVGNRRDVDARNVRLDAAVVVGHRLLGLGVADRGGRDENSSEAGTEEAHETSR